MAPLQANRRDLFPGDSEMARRMRQLDWTSTDVGPPEQWPENLRTAVSLCLTSRFPIVLWLGPRLSVLYNDAYIPFLGSAKHPRVLGRPGQECWGEIWDDIGPRLNKVMAGGEATWLEDYLFFFARKLPLEEVYVTFTYAPIIAADGRGVDGVFCPCYETTEKVVGARRLETLRKLGVRTGEARSVLTVCRQAAVVLRANPQDVPFAAIYIVDDRRKHITLSAGAVPGGESHLPYRMGLDEGTASGWPLVEVVADEQPRWVSLDDLGAHLPGRAWPEPIREAMVLPVPAAGRDHPAGVLVLGVGQRRVLDNDYRTFFDLVAGQVGSALDKALAYQSERRRAEGLAEIDRVKTAFFSNVSHEFRTPLTLLLGPLEDCLADEQGNLPEAQRQRLEIAHRNSLRLLKLVNTLLDFSRIQAGRVQASYEPVDLGSLTADLASNFRAACEQVGIQLRILCHAGPGSSDIAYVDRDMWEKVVLNLLSNAFKFTLVGSITVSLRFERGMAQLSVMDTGKGIPAAALPHLFERFYQVPGAEGRTREGSGIGLSLVAELVKLHGGSVRVTSAPGSGSHFTVSIPLGTAHLPADQISPRRYRRSIAASTRSFVEEALRWLPGMALRRETDASALMSALEPQQQSSRLGRPRILWADDNADMREYVERLLGPLYEVQAVTNGELALEAARISPPDLVLSDVMMPRMDGFELLRELRSDPLTRDVPVILVSARAGEESRIEGLEAGADDYLIKPFSARELLARVVGALRLAEVRRKALLQEEQLRGEMVDILESMSDGFMALDPDWRIRYVNAAAEITNNMKRETLLGRNLWEAFPELSGTEFAHNLRRAMTERVSIRAEAYYPPYDRWFALNVYPIKEHQLGYYGRDITEQKRAADAQLRLQQERDEILDRLNLQ
ncbi:MAG TPA: ATP-binding protein, partial [Gemmatimonadales bacterium]